MGLLLDRLAEKSVLVSDGAWGTMLQEKGLKVGDCPEEWNVSHPDEVRAVAKAYADAGADMVLTNTFGGAPVKLKKFGYADKVADFNKAGAILSREGALECVIAASVGPSGEFIEPYGDMTEEQMEAIFAEQIEALVAGGVDAICVETMTAVEEAVCALRAAKKVKPDIDVICTLTFDPSPNGFKTMMGVDCERAATELTEAGADVIGSNCGNGVEQMISIARELGSFSDRPILIHANAGVPELVDGKTVFRQSPEEMAARVGDLVEAGATLIGGCCGTNPAHISAIRAAVDRVRS